MIRPITILFLIVLWTSSIAVPDTCKNLSSNGSIDMDTYYDVLSGSSLDRIDSLLMVLENSVASSTVLAYKGTLFMKRAFLISPPAKKLNSFKKGKRLLEAEIKEHPQNIEYRFLRLSVQEHAPDFLKYNKSTISDKAMIINGFNKTNKSLKKIIRDYSIHSKIIHEDDLR